MNHTPGETVLILRDIGTLKEGTEVEILGINRFNQYWTKHKNIFYVFEDKDCQP